MPVLGGIYATEKLGTRKGNYIGHYTGGSFCDHAQVHTSGWVVVFYAVFPVRRSPSSTHASERSSSCRCDVSTRRRCRISDHVHCRTLNDDCQSDRTHARTTMVRPYCEYERLKSMRKAKIHILTDSADRHEMTKGLYSAGHGCLRLLRRRPLQAAILRGIPGNADSKFPAQLLMTGNNQILVLVIDLYILCRLVAV